MSEQPLIEVRAGPAPAAASQPTATWKHWVALVGVALGAILVDQATKAYASAHLALYESWMPLDFLRPVFKFTLTHNTGVAFGMFPEGGWLFLVIPPIAAAVIVYYYRQLAPNGWLVRLALGLQLAGALGNFIDRLRQGYVVDFFHVTHWPVFNVADSCIVVGVGLLLATMLYDDWRASRLPRKSAESEPGSS